jgi:hypothetical protein
MMISNQKRLHKKNWFDICRFLELSHFVRFRKSASSISLNGSRLDLCRGPEMNHLAWVLNEAIYYCFCFYSPKAMP